MKKPSLKDYDISRTPDSIKSDFYLYQHEHSEQAFRKYLESKYDNSVISDEELRVEKERATKISIAIAVVIVLIIALYIYLHGNKDLAYVCVACGAIPVYILDCIIESLFFSSKLKELERNTYSHLKDLEYQAYIDYVENKYWSVLKEKQSLDRYYKDLEAYNAEKARQSVNYWNSLDGNEFEIEVANLFRKLGYSANVSPIGPDQGVDIILTKKGKRYAVQCKAHKAKVSQAVARDLLGTISNRANPFDGGFLVCTHGVSKNTAEWCRNNRITVYKTEDLVELSKRGSSKTTSKSQDSNNEERIPCPYCNGYLVIRSGPHGFFYGCSNYPSCRYTKSLN